MRIWTMAFAALALASTPALADKLRPEPRIQAAVTVEPVVPVSDEERRATYVAAGRILKHVDQARTALTKKDRGEATRHVTQAVLLTDIIRASLPVYDVKAKISAGDLTYEDREQVQETVVPIFDELERAALLSPVKDAKIDAQDDATQATAVVDVELVHTRAELDIDLARLHLDAALAEIKGRDFEAAVASLGAIQTGVRLSRVEIDLPLERARSNLMLARDRVDEGRLEDARFALRVAMDALDDYQAMAQEARAKEASALKAEMARLQNTLQGNAGKARDMIDAWWDLLSEWAR